MNKGQLIIINGASSSGKTSTCRAMQDKFDKLHVLLGLDCFSQITPPKQNNMQTIEPSFFTAKKYQKNGLDYFDITTGPLLNDVIYTSYKAISMYLEEGINVISDQLFWSSEWFQNALHIFNPYNVFFVGLHVSEQEGARREQLRGEGNPYDIIENGRLDGWNRSSAAVTHANMIYDFEIDSTNLSVQDTAEQIIVAYKSTPNPTAFKTLAQKIL